MSKPPRLVLEAYGELSFGRRQYVKGGPRKTSWMAWLIFATLSSFFSNVALVSTRAKLPLCTRAHMQALMT